MMALWTITTFKTLIPAALECPCGGTGLACGLAISICTAHIAKQAPTGTGEEMEAILQETQATPREAGNVATQLQRLVKDPHKTSQPLPPGCYQLQKGEEKPVPQKHAWWWTENKCPVHEMHCYSWKTVQGLQNLFSVKALTYPKHTVDFYSLSTNTNTGTCRQATVQAFPSDIKAIWLTAGGRPLWKKRALQMSQTSTPAPQAVRQQHLHCLFLIPLLDQEGSGFTWPRLLGQKHGHAKELSITATFADPKGAP